MGTRYLIGVKKDNEFKVAQYGGWDGYPDGAGANVVSCIKDWDKDKFIDCLNKCEFINRDLYRMYINNKMDSPEYSALIEKYRDIHYTLSSSTGADILYYITDTDAEKIALYDSSSFIKDSLFCEFAYIINLDTNKLEYYLGFQKHPFDDNEYGTEITHGYYPCKKEAEFDLDNITEDAVDMMNNIWKFKNEQEG